jgi:hypothetical protein
MEASRLDDAIGMFAYVASGEGITDRLIGNRCAVLYGRLMYIIIKTVKGRQYRYLQWSWREGKKVRTKSRSLGSAGHALRVIGSIVESFRASPYGVDEETVLKESNVHCERLARERQAHLAKLHAAYGLRLPNTNAARPANHMAITEPKESPSNAEGRITEACERGDSE